MNLNPEILKTYKRLRTDGMKPAHALHAARALHAFRELETEGLVGLNAELETEGYFDVYGEPDGYVNRQGHWVTPEQERKEICETIERDGCYCISSQVFHGCPHCGRGEWETVDSVGMCSGYKWVLDPFENWYVFDLMAAAVDALA